MLYCGDELSISGRFSQNVLHPVTEVCQVLGYEVRFGDSRIVRSFERKRAVELAKKAVGFKGKLTELNPDIVACDKDHNTRFVGELKTSWTVKLDDLMKIDRKERFRACLGRFIFSYFWHGLSNAGLQDR